MLRERPILFSAPMVRAILEGRKTVTRRIVKLPHDNPLGAWEPTTVGGRDARGIEHQARAAIWHTRTGDTIACPYGQPGDRLWVRETFGFVTHTWDENENLIDWLPDRPATPCRELSFGNGYYSGHVIYAADGHHEWAGDDDGGGEPRSAWKPSIHMPRAASRITLEVTGVRVERLQDISDADAIAEGCFFTNYGRDCGHSGRGWTDVGNCPAPAAHHPQRNGWMWDETTGPDECLMSARWAFANLWQSINGEGSWDANPWVWVIEFQQAAGAPAANI